jgi:quinol monooxygenase YgiN
MAGFVQIIEYKTSRPEEVGELTEQYRKSRAAGTKGPTPTQAITGADRDRPGHYFAIVEFESYDAAMKNSARPDTSEFAAKMTKLCDGRPTFHNLDITQSMKY